MDHYECHGHIFMDGENFRKARDRHKNGVDKVYVRKVLEAMQAAGITYFREGGDPFGVSLYAREIAGEYGITVVTPGFAIHKKGHYGSIVGRAWETMDDYRRLLDEVRREKGDFVKLMLSGILTFRQNGELSEAGLAEEETHTLISLAHEAGFAVMAHVNGEETVRTAVEAGVDSVEHGCFLTEATLCRMAASRTIWVPTLSALHAFVGREGFDPEVTETVFREQQQRAALFSRLGGTLACGSDAGAVGVMHGEGALEEYALLLASGVTAEAVDRGNQALRERFWADGGHI